MALCRQCHTDTSLSVGTRESSCLQGGNFHGFLAKPQLKQLASFRVWVAGENGCFKTLALYIRGELTLLSPCVVFFYSSNAFCLSLPAFFGLMFTWYIVFHFFHFQTFSCKQCVIVFYFYPLTIYVIFMGTFSPFTFNVIGDILSLTPPSMFAFYLFCLFYVPLSPFLPSFELLLYSLLFSSLLVC